MNLGDNIKELRKKLGLTQEELASKCNLSKNGLWNYEKNRRKPNITTLTKIANALDVSITELLEDKETLTNKLIKYMDNTIYKDCDQENTLELLCEDIDIDIDTLNNIVNEETDLSESYLISMFDVIYEFDSKLFITFFCDNHRLIYNNYSLCFKKCLRLINDYVTKNPNSRNKLLNNIENDKYFKYMLGYLDAQDKELENKLSNTNYNEYYKNNILNYWEDIIMRYPLDKKNGFDLYKLTDEEMTELANCLSFAFDLKLKEICNRHKNDK